MDLNSVWAIAMDPEITEPSTSRAVPGNGAASPARLALRRVQIDTYHENVAYMHRDCEVYRVEGFQALSKVEIRAKGSHILASLNVVDEEAIVACGHLGLSKAAFSQIGVEEGHLVSVSQAEPPALICAV
jgi:thymidine phosphorylase